MYAIHFQNIKPGHQKWYYMAIRFNAEKEWVVTAGWGKIGYAISPANIKHQSTKEDGSKFSSADDALSLLLGAIDKRLKNNYTIIYCTPRLLGKLLTELPASISNNPYDGVITEWNTMYRRGHNAPVDHAPQWFKDVITAKAGAASPAKEASKPDISELFKKAPVKDKTEAPGKRKIDTLTAKVRSMTTEEENEDGDCKACDGKGWVKNRIGKNKRCSLCNTPDTVEGSDEDKPRSRRSKRLKEKQESGNEPTNIKRAAAPGSIRRLFNFHS